MRWKFGRRTKPDARLPKKRVRIVLALILLILPLITSVVTPLLASTASADASCPTSQADIKNGQYSWWDRNTIHGLIGGTLYIFRGIESGGATYYDVQNSNCYGRISFDNGHNPYIEPAPNVGLAPSGRYSQVPQSINVNMDYTDPNSSSPGAHLSTDPDTLPRISISNPQTNSKNNFSTFFYVSDNGRQILPVSGDDSHDYTQSSVNANWFLRDSEDGDNCQDVILVDKANGTYKSYEMDPNGSGPAPPASIKAPDGCKLVGDPSDPTNGYVQMDINQFLGNADALKGDPNPGGPDGAGGGGGGSTQPLTCDAQFTSSLTWIICPVIDDLLVPAIEKTDALITQQMVIPTQNIFCSDTTNPDCNAYYSAWANFRNLALGLLAAVGMVVIVAQAIGMEILDAYTIRRTLPRLLVAAIGITLSWPLMNFAVTLSNNLGFGIRDLIIAPFHTLGDSINVSGIFGSGAGDLIGGFVTILVGGTIAAIAGMGILLSYLATAGLAVLVAVLVLVLRQIVVIMLVILSPVALLAYVLPNTQRTFRLWWDTFLRALLMFPMIAALIAAGRVFSAISLSPGNSGDLFNQIIGFVAYFAPYFMIPLTFRFSGGLMSGVGNFVNQRAQPFLERGRKYRGEKFSGNWKKARAGQRWNEDFARFKNPITGKQSGIGHLANRMAVNVSDQDEMLPYRLGKPRDFINPLTGKKWSGTPGFRRGAADLQDQLDNRSITESQKLLQEINQNGGMHYEAWRGIAGQVMDYKGRDAQGRLISDRLAEAGFVDSKTGEVKPPSSIGDFRKMGEILQESDNDKERLGGADIMEHAGTLASAKRHPEMEYADTQVAASIALSAAGRAEPEQLANIANSVQGRLGAGVAQRTIKASQGAASRTERPDLRDGHGIIFNGNTHKYESSYSEDNYKSDTAVGSVLSVKGSSWSAAKAEGVIAAAPTIIHIARGGTGDETEAQTMRETIRDGLRNPYNDAGQRKAWREVAETAQLDIDDLMKGGMGGDMSMGELPWDQMQLPTPEPEAPPPGEAQPPAA